MSPKRKHKKKKKQSAQAAGKKQNAEQTPLQEEQADSESQERIAAEEETIRDEQEATASSNEEDEQPKGDSKEQDDEQEPHEREMTLVEHLDELRIRLTHCAIAGFVGFLACYGFAEQLFDLMLEPLKPVLPEDSTLIFTSLPEGFFTYVKLAAVAGIFVVSPYIFYQLWLFTAPALYPKERRWLVPIACVSAFFFVSGGLFGYFVVFPFAFEFFMGFSTEVIRAMPSLKEYLSFTLKLLFAFGVAFELPVFIFFLAKLGIVSSKGLRKFRKYAVLCSFVCSALLTPPDVISQMFMAGPLIILYELGVWTAHFFGKRKEPPQEENAGAESP